MTKGKITLFTAIFMAFAFFVSCGEHSFFDEIFGEASSSSGGNGEPALQSSSSAGDECLEEICKNEVEIIDVVPPDDDDVVVPPETPNSNAVVGPLIQTKWKQRDPYNSMFPICVTYHEGCETVGEQARTGCQLIAWAQIMKYHNYPKQGKGQTEPYFVGGTETLLPSVNLEISYDWDNMLNTYTSNATEQQRNAVATLMYHLMFVRPWRCFDCIITNFGYDKSVRQLWRKYYDNATWEAIIRKQLDVGLPVYYGGEGHLFIIDGYDNTGKFHINWGWNGLHDGYYSLNALNPGNYDFNDNNHMTINIKPDAGSVGSNEMDLDRFTSSKTSVFQNELITVSAKMRSQGFFPGGHVGTALVDNNGNIIAIIGSSAISYAMDPGWSNTREITSYVPSTIAPGQYSLRVVTKIEDGEWKIVDVSDISNNTPKAISITVKAEKGSPGGGYGLTLMSFSTSKTTVSQSELVSGLAVNKTIVSQNEQFTVSASLKNLTADTIFHGGQVGAVLTDGNGNIKAILGTVNISFAMEPWWQITRDIPSKVPADVAPGQYKLRIAAKATGDEWRIATLSMPDVPNSINLEVK